MKKFFAVLLGILIGLIVSSVIIGSARAIEILLQKIGFWI